MLGLAQCVVIYFLGKKRNFTKSDVPLSHKEKVEVCSTAVSALIMPIIIIGGIVSGIFTATEAAAVAVIYALVIGLFVYRNITLHTLLQALKTTITTTAGIYLIIGFTGIVSWILAMETVPALITSFVAKSHISVYALLFLVNIFFLFNGMWISDTAQLILFAATSNKQGQDHRCRKCKG